MKFKFMYIFLLLTILLLPACSGKEAVEGNESGGSVDEDGNITLEFWYALGGDSGTAVEDLVAQFNEAYPEIEVVATYQGNYTSAMAKV